MSDTKSKKPTKNKSCIKCPSLMSEAVQIVRYGKSSGGLMCGQFGTALSNASLSSETVDDVLLHKGNKCSKHGSNMPMKVTPNLLVTLPDPVVRRDDPDEYGHISSALKPSACNVCRNFTPDYNVASELGWSIGLCSAKGKLVFPKFYSATAVDCEIGVYGATRHDLSEVQLLPEFSDSFSTPLNPITAFLAGTGSLPDPTEYETDKPVESSDEKRGIRAWREITDPDNDTRNVWLPIYRTDHFSKDQQELIPKTGGDEHPELYVDHFGGVYVVAVAWTALDETPMLSGQAGTGKTELFRHIAWLMNVPFRRISITDSTELDDLAGKMRFVPEKGTYFQYGRLSHAWTEPGVLCLDEPNTGPADVWQFIRPLTDNSKQLALDVNEGEILERDLDCYLGMAINPSWDVRNIGAHEISDADANRLFHVEVPMPDPKIEIEIIKSRVKLDGWELSSDQEKLLMGVAADLRALSADDGLSVTWAIRPQIKVARALRWFEPVVAYRRAIADHLSPDDRQVILDAVKSHTI